MHKFTRTLLTQPARIHTHVKQNNPIIHRLTAALMQDILTGAVPQRRRNLLQKRRVPRLLWRSVKHFPSGRFQLFREVVNHTNQICLHARLPHIKLFPKSQQNNFKFTSKSYNNHTNITPKSFQNQPNIKPQSPQSHSKITQKSYQHHDTIIVKSHQHQHQIIPELLI